MKSYQHYENEYQRKLKQPFSTDGMVTRPQWWEILIVVLVMVALLVVGVTVVYKQVQIDHHEKVKE